MNKTQRTIELLWGIPGSGKSTYAKQCGLSERDIIDVDHITRLYKKIGKDLLGAILEEVECRFYNNARSKVIIDGLVTTNAVAKSIIDILVDNLKQYDLIFKIMWWERDVEAALHNDKYRRNQTSEITIQNIPFEKPDVKILGNNVKNVTHMKIVKKPAVDVWIYEVRGNSDKTLESDSWCLGGTWGNCWGEKGTVSSEPQPTAFQEFDELIEKICPSISFMQYKRIYNETVKIVECGYGDYYGGYRNNAKFQCDLVKLHEMLSEMGLINEKES